MRIAVGAEMAESGEIPASAVLMFSVDPSRIGANQTLVMYGSMVPYEGKPEGALLSNVQVAEGSVGPCEPVPVLPRFGG